MVHLLALAFPRGELKNGEACICRHQDDPPPSSQRKERSSATTTSFAMKDPLRQPDQHEYRKEEFYDSLQQSNESNLRRVDNKTQRFVLSDTHFLHFNTPKRLNQ
ncbi:piwi-like protein [Perkinsela sp. CCAP 1560/4]|nr:piwi-like protein [Perkinsela sp. CCAP 1560/4]|eukprot:KNH08495.1 piwi-like protein [Perkinsela sp. CCAP 1560/4]